MFFNSVIYIVFLPLVVILYYLLPHKYRWILLLAASYYFYMCWEPGYIILIVFSTLVDYFCGIKMEKYLDKKKRSPYLFFSLLTNLGLLFTFKYFNFFSESIGPVLTHYNVISEIPRLKFLLPVGISFYTFQTLSYTIEVYRGKQAAERHLGIFSTYVAYFPQLVAGPIERFDRLGKQLKHKHYFHYHNLANGFRLILYGLFIKMVIADNIFPYVDAIYEDPGKYNSLSIILGTIFYSFQIYSDFYGYSLIAIGSALLMGIKIINNFQAPYLAKNITEFWHRWHISLSTWFKDYLFIPLGGSRVKKYRWIINILFVFTISGLWHGAAWTFIIWGALHGLLYVAEQVYPVCFTCLKPFFL